MRTSRLLKQKVMTRRKSQDINPDTITTEERERTDV